MPMTLANSDNEIMATYPVMLELRPGMTEEEYLVRVQAQQVQGYRLAFLEQDFEVLAVAGFHIYENLAWGPYLYVDDLITTASNRHQGHAAELMNWLQETARNEGCAQLHLDCGNQRQDAQHFYGSIGMNKAGIHYIHTLT